MQGIYTYIPETNYVPREYIIIFIIIIIIINCEWACTYWKCATMQDRTIQYSAVQ